MLKSTGGQPDVDERYAALLTNSSAVRAVASAVEGTLGPKGLDCMMVDPHGGIVITNDGVTILQRMDAGHPAARMVVNAARAQQQQVGDGTTTATIMAGTLITEGVEQVLRGVPVARVIEGVRFGVSQALEAFAGIARRVETLNDPLLEQVALTAGRGHADIARQVCEAARLVGPEQLLDPAFKLSGAVLSYEGAAGEVFSGVVVDRRRLNRDMPVRVQDARVLVIDDALEPEEIEGEALATESGFARYLALRDGFIQNIRDVIALGVNVVMTDRGISDLAEEVLVDAGVLAVQRVASAELRRVAEHTGARALKRTGLKRSPDELAGCLGRAAEVYEDEKLEHIRVKGGAGRPAATVLVGAATAEVVGERERIARDAADSYQCAFAGGVVPGGGAVELAVMRRLSRVRETMQGMAAYGVDCVLAALKRPLAQIALNAGFNPLEKVEQVLAAQAHDQNDALGVDCDSGEVRDLCAAGVVDPAPVKVHALRAAGELAEAILRINTIIKQRESDILAGEERMSP